MSQKSQNRVDEVNRYYEPVGKIGKATGSLFWIIAGVSLFIPYAKAEIEIKIQPLFICLVLIYFCLSQFSRFYLLPKAERKRRQQLLSNSFGAPLSHDRTALYYNNEYTPNIVRLGANTMENSFFSKEVAGQMLFPKRIITFAYMIIWIFLFALPECKPETLMWITQLVFSTEIFIQWLTLELLRSSYKDTYDALHSLFLNGIDDESPKVIATILDFFTAYEVAKHSAGFLLSSKVFFKLNEELTQRWKQIREDLNMK
ncbi:MAG: hypothetical protein KKE62_07365 [Proteobacteria bacterium]|nr:hypothetical protein [Pseudomonadota bacterium]MBU1389711.1 hypothetical protein [Pseudomonadota bacterium]MBU1542649.1 hypothetical protein [Pseudomonadota bacterium]MBU2429492.1 hypothetical protein [Pseudomonadota bacterium]MBU2479523.1 hypothetical protein [Pseudomonadota bacterium]